MEVLAVDRICAEVMPVEPARELGLGQPGLWDRGCSIATLGQTRGASLGLPQERGALRS
jgi:hypothetical protein